MGEGVEALPLRREPDVPRSSLSGARGSSGTCHWEGGGGVGAPETGAAGPPCPVAFCWQLGLLCALLT